MIKQAREKQRRMEMRSPKKKIKEFKFNKRPQVNSH